MRSYTPREIAFFISLAVAGLVAAGVVLTAYILQQPINWLLPVIVSAITLAASYLLILYGIERFIQRKIRLIYKTIHNLKRQKGDATLDTSKDVLNEVNREVVEWAEGRKQEIEALKEQEQFRREFIGNLSHELKTPIFNIQGYLLTLIEGGLEDETINREYLHRAENNLQRLIDLVEDLDVINKLESKREYIALERTNVVEIANDVFNSLDLKAKARAITLKFNKAYDRPIWVLADKVKIGQVISNLVVNSINYGRENGGETEVRFYDMDENILIEIADNGIGISSKHLSRLFERFYRIDKSRARHAGGSGLGLAIVKHIVEAHKQTINVRSTENVGSTFSFTLKKAR